MIIQSRSGRRVEVALAHNESRCVTRADYPSPSLCQASSGVGYYSITRPVGVGVDALKAVGPLGFPFIYRPARSPRTRSGAGIASTHPLTAVAPACEAGTGFGILPVQVLRLQLGGGINSCSVHPAPAKACRVNCVVGQELTTRCGRLYLRRSGWQSDKATAKAYAGEELSV